jgi:hypothetical protein
VDRPRSHPAGAGPRAAEVNGGRKQLSPTRSLRSGDVAASTSTTIQNGRHGCGRRNQDSSSSGASTRSRLIPASRTIARMCRRRRSSYSTPDASHSTPRQTKLRSYSVDAKEVDAELLIFLDGKAARSQTEAAQAQPESLREDYGGHDAEAGAKSHELPIPDGAGR